MLRTRAFWGERLWDLAAVFLAELVAFGVNMLRRPVQPGSGSRGWVRVLMGVRAALGLVLLGVCGPMLGPAWRGHIQSHGGFPEEGCEVCGGFISLVEAMQAMELLEADLARMADEESSKEGQREKV